MHRSWLPIFPIAFLLISLLSPSWAQLSVSVRDTNDAPVPGARVLLIGNTGIAGIKPPAAAEAVEPVVRTDAQGKAVFPGVALGEVTALAAHGLSFGQVKIAPGADAVVALQPAAPSKGDGAARVAELIAQWERDAAERDRKTPPAKNSARVQPARVLAFRLAGIDPDMAVRVATGAHQEPEDYVLRQIIVRLARRDPKRAAAWAPEPLESLDPGFHRSAAAFELVLALGKTHPELAKQLMEGEAAAVHPKDFSAESASNFAYLTAMAGVLGDPRGDMWLQSLQLSLDQGENKGRKVDMLAYFAGQIARGNLPAIEKLIPALAPDAQLWVLAGVIPVVAETDMPTARRLLTTLETVAAKLEAPQTGGRNRSSPQRALVNAYHAIAKALAPTDPQAALEMLRKSKGSQDRRIGAYFVTMATIAGYLKGEAAAATFREAMEAAQQGGDGAALIAAMAGNHDPALGEEFFHRERRRALGRVAQIETANYSPLFAPYAYYHAAFDPADSRLLLEAEWRLRQAAFERAKKNGNTNNVNALAAQQMGVIANAMMAVDIERALEMVGEVLAITNSYSDPRLFAIDYLLATSAERRELRVEEALRVWDWW